MIRGRDSLEGHNTAASLCTLHASTLRLQISFGGENSIQPIRRSQKGGSALGPAFSQNVGPATHIHIINGRKHRPQTKRHADNIMHAKKERQRADRLYTSRGGYIMSFEIGPANCKGVYPRSHLGSSGGAANFNQEEFAHVYTL